MRIAIVDDVSEDRKFLQVCLKRYATERKLVFAAEEFSSGAAFLHCGKVFDVAFLDIYMTGMNGIEVAEKLRMNNTNTLLVFSTSSSSHAVQSFRVRAFDYLVKPYTYEQLAEVMKLCEENMASESYYIELKEGRSKVKIVVKDIIYADYSNHYSLIHTANQVIRSYMPFGELEALLKNQRQFLSCARNCLLNMDKVTGITDVEFILANGIHLSMARNLRAALRQQYADFIFHKMNGDVLR